MSIAMSPPTLSGYADRIAVLADDEAPLSVLEGDGWTRIHGQLRPGARVYAVMAFARGSEVVRVEACERRPPEGALPHRDVGWLRSVRLPDDPRLPALPALFAAPVAVTVVSYRPFSRCTVLVDTPAGRRFGKVFSEGEAPLVDREGRAVWAAAQRGELGFAVPRPAGFDEAAGVLWQEPVAGVPARDRLLGPEGAGLAERAGAAAASLPLSSLRPLRAIDRDTAFLRLARRAEELARFAPELGDRVHAVLEDVRPLHADADPQPLRPVHGDLNLGQWLADGDRLALVDFEDLVLGEPERDVARFLADLRPDRAPEAAAAFVQGYEAVAGRLDRRLLAAYGAARTVRRAQKAAQTLERDAEEQAERMLERAARWANGEWL